MVICKFFLQGNCRFGENCKFEHQLKDSAHTSIIRQPQNVTPSTANSNIDTNTLIRAVTNDMITAEKGGQWLLSCYAPFKEKPNFPGFEEHSFEEIRWNYQEAQRLNSLEQYYQQLQIALQGAIMKMRALQNPSQEIIDTIKNIYYTSTATKTFGNSFPTNSNPTSIFAAANQKLFGPTQPQGNSIFNNQSIFGNSSQTMDMGGPSMINQNPFRAFAQQQTPVPFGSQPLTNSSIFATQNQMPFGIPQQTEVPSFNSQPPVQQGIAPQEILNTPFGLGSNVFNMNTQFSNKVGGGTLNMNDKGIYSQLEDLSESDIKCYENDTFEFGKIPEKPPTYQMCF